MSIAYRRNVIYAGFLVVYSLLFLPVLLLANKADNAHPERTSNQPAGWWWFTNVNASQVSAYLKKHKARLIDVQVTSTSPLKFNVAMVKNQGIYSNGWWWYYGKTEQQVNSIAKAKKARILDIEKYRHKGKTYFAAILVQNQGAYASGWWWYHGKTAAQVNSLVKSKNARLIDVDVENAAKPLFTVVMVSNSGKNRQGWWWYYGKTENQLNSTTKAKKARIVDLEPYRVGGKTYYAFIMHPNTGGASSYWWWYRNMSAAQVSHLALRHSARVIDVETHRSGGKTYYHVAMIDNGLPKSGKAVSQFKSFDRRITRLMKRWAIPGASLAVVKDGRLVYARGYGYADIDKQKIVQPTSQFRLASISKPITATSINLLEKKGKLKKSDKIMKYLGGIVKGIKLKDKRINNIRIQHLIDHKGGWVIKKLKFDPMFYSDQVAKAMKTPRPSRCKTIIRYMFKNHKLNYTPGGTGGYSGRDRYSNFGYCILGRIIEKAGGTSYENYVRRHVLKPVKADGMRIGRSLEHLRYPHEVKYYNTIFAKKVNSVFPNQKKVKRQYGGWYLEAMDAHGGWIASTVQLARYANAPDSVPWNFNGAFTGSETRLIDKGNIIVVFLTNTRSGDSKAGDEMSDQINKALDEVKSWPRHNYFNLYR